MKLQRSQKTSELLWKSGENPSLFQARRVRKDKHSLILYYVIKPDNFSLGYASCLSERVPDFQKGKWAGQGLITSDDDQLYGLRRYWTTSTKDNAKKLTQYPMSIKSDRDLTLGDNVRKTELSSKL